MHSSRMFRAGILTSLDVGFYNISKEANMTSLAHAQLPIVRGHDCDASLVPQ